MEYKKVLFQGVEYEVPEWATVITKDTEGDLFCHQNKPYIFGTEYVSTGFRKFLGNNNTHYDGNGYSEDNYDAA